MKKNQTLNCRTTNWSNVFIQEMVAILTFPCVTINQRHYEIPNHQEKKKIKNLKLLYALLKLSLAKLVNTLYQCRGYKIKNNM